MAGWNGNGTFDRTYNWQQDQANGIKITAVRHDQNDTDFVNGINNCLTKDGQNIATADLPMGGFKHTNVADAAARNQYATLGQVQDGAGAYYTTGGSSNAYVVTPSPAIASYTAGQKFYIKASFTNTGAATINVSGLGAKNLTKQGTNALASGDIVSGTIYEIQYDGTQFQILNSNLLFTLKGNYTIDGTLGITGAATLSSTLAVADNITIGSGNPIAGNRIIDIINLDTTSTSGSLQRFITKNVAGSGNSSFDIIKYKNGTVLYNNNETNTAANHSFALGSLGGGSALILAADSGGTTFSTNFSTKSTTGTAVIDVKQGRDGASNTHNYAVLSTIIEDATNGSEDGSYLIQASKASVTTDALKVGFNSSAQNVFTIHGTDIYTSGEKVIAQCRFNASTGTPTIVDSYNVTSITDNGVGDFTINLTTGVATATKIHAQISVGHESIMPTGYISTITTNSVRVLTRRWNSGTTELAADLTNDVFVTIYAKVY